MFFFQVRKNVLDVQYHVSQYQSIISELKGEIARLKDKMNVDSSLTKNQPPSANKKIQEELKELRDAFVINFNEQMKLRLVKRLSVLECSTNFFPKKRTKD